MELKIKEKTQKNSWISTTAYRVFLVLKSLMENPKTLDELMFIAKNDSHLNKTVSKDTIRFDINTLKNSGCKISTPTRTNGYKYCLLNHPFKLNIYDNEMDILLELREYLTGELSLDNVLELNNLFDKIAQLTLDTDKIDFIHNSGALLDVNKDILKQITNPNIINKRVQIRYKSPKFGEENADIIPIKVLYENKKVYLSAYNLKYEKNSLFELPKILKINSVSINTEIIKSTVFNVVYEVLGDALNYFDLKDYEHIIEKSDEKVTIEANVDNEFMFIQRLLLLGRNFKIISPDFFKEKLINKIELIQKGYINA